MTDWVTFAGFTGLVLAVLLSPAHFFRGVPYAEKIDSDTLDAPVVLGDDASDSDPRATIVDGSVPTAAESGGTDWSAKLDTVPLTSLSVDSTGVSPRSEPSTSVEAGVVGNAHADVDAGPEPDSDRAMPPGVTTAPASAVSERLASAEGFPPHPLFANVASSQAFFGNFLGPGAWYAGAPTAALGLSAVDLSMRLAVDIGFGLALYGTSRVGSTVSEWFGVTLDEMIHESLAPRTTTGWVFLFAAVPPLIIGFEELLSQGVLVGTVAAGFDVSPWLITAALSAAFSAGHGAQGRLGVIVTGPLGFVLATAFILTGSLLAVVVVHYLVNALEFANHELFGWQRDLPTLASVTTAEPPAVATAARRCVQASASHVVGMDIDTRQLTQTGFIGYLVLAVAAFATGSPMLRLATDAVFGPTVVLLGVVTLRVPVDSQFRYVAGDGLPLAGILQFAELATGVQSAGLTGTLFLPAGLLGYLALRREIGAMLF